MSQSLEQHPEAKQQEVADDLDGVLMAKADTKAAKDRGAGVGQSVKAGIEVKLKDDRGWGNLGPEGKYSINPTISATLGKKFNEIGDPTIALGDSLLGSHVQLKVENAETKREAADGGHQQIRFNARYTLKNAAEWKTPKMSLNMKVANTSELKGSVDARAPLKIAGVGVEGGANVNGGNTTTAEVGAAINEFQAGGTNSFFGHSYDLEMVVSSSGYAVAGIRRSYGSGDKSPKEVYAEQKTYTEQVKSNGQKAYNGSAVTKKNMPLLQ